MTNDWQTVPLGEVANRIERAEAPIAGTTYRQVGVRLWGQGAYERETIDGSQTKYATLSRVESGDIIVNKIWARNGSVAVVSDKISGCFGSGEFPTFAPDRKRLEPRWFHWMTKTKWLWQACDEKSQGTSGKNRIRPEKFLEIEIPLPSLDEQRRIVERVEVLAARIAKAQSLREEATVEADKLFAAESFKLFSETKEQYEIKSFGSFSPHVTSGPRYWRDRYSDNGRRFYRAQDIGSRGNIFPDSKAYVTPPDSDQGKTALLEHGDLMIVITGATVGRCAIYTDDLEPGYVSQHVSICRLPQDKVLPRYALLWLLSPDGQQQLLGQRYGQGKPGLNLTNIRSIVIPIPPLDEQRRIVAYLDSIQARLASLRELQAETGEELSALLPSVLDKAFRGEL
jgi:type I restriction enzyme, S subunit